MTNDPATLKEIWQLVHAILCGAFLGNYMVNYLEVI